MTVIAFDGRSIAADKRTSFGGLHGISTKVFRVNGDLVGCCGNSAQGVEMRHWFESGAKPESFPTQQRSIAECVTMMVVKSDGAILIYENAPFPYQIENKHWAIGSGRDFAMAAMHLGRNAYQAVEVASLLESGCGNGVDVLSLNGTQE